MMKEPPLIPIDENGYLTLKGGGGGESVSQSFGQFFTVHKLTEQQTFISFSQSIYKRINIYLFI